MLHGSNVAFAWSGDVEQFILWKAGLPLPAARAPDLLR